MFKVSVVIPNWNGVNKLKANLPKIQEMVGTVEVIVVDDSSTDGSVEYIKSNFPKIILLEKNNNSGFSSTVNLGVKKALGDLIFLLNSDAVPEKNCLRYITPLFNDPRVFSVSCNTGGSYSWARFNEGFFWHFMSGRKITYSHQTLWTSGGSGVYRKNIWDKLGGFDEIFDPFYEEDLDLGYRATKRGFINLWEPKARVEHGKYKGVIEENFSKMKISKIAQRNQLLFIWKNITSTNLINDHIIHLTKRLLSNPKYFIIFIMAVYRIKKVRDKRSIEVEEEVISDEEILKKFTD